MTGETSRTLSALYPVSSSSSRIAALSGDSPLSIKPSFPVVNTPMDPHFLERTSG